MPQSSARTSGAGDPYAASLDAAPGSDRPAEAAFEAWAAPGDGKPWWPVLESVLSAAVNLHPSIASAVSTRPGALGLALVDRSGRAYFTQPRFSEWIGDPAWSQDCRRLVRRAEVERTAVGLVRSTVAGSVFAVAAARLASHLKWVPEGLGGETLPVPRANSFALMAFAPSRSPVLMARASQALGLSPLQARVAEAMVDAPSLSIAAKYLGISRETAKDAMRGAMRKAGAANATQLVGQMVEIGCEITSLDEKGLSGLGSAARFTPAETRVAAAIAAGSTATEIALAEGVSEASVKSRRASVFRKSSLGRSRDLRRLAAEFAALERISSSSQVLAIPEGEREALKVLSVGTRRVAFIDYGPATGTCLILGHGFFTGRLAPDTLAAACASAGYRIVIPQRPGFGLTDPAQGDYLETAADDLAQILDHLNVGATRLLTRDGGGACAFTFAARHGGRLDRPVLINPSNPAGVTMSGPRPLSSMSRFLLDRPTMIEPFVQMIARQTRHDVLAALFRRLCASCAADREAVEDAALMARLVRDLHGMFARSSRGAVDEGHVFASGWRPPADGAGIGWRIAHCGGLWPSMEVKEAPWRELPDVIFSRLAGAGLLVAVTHTTALVELLS